MGSAPNEFSVQGPAGIVIETDRPTFRWTALGGATYTVSIYDSNVSKVAESDSLTSTEWTPPTALARGRTYVWQVRATTSDGQQVVAPSPAAGRAKFKVLEQSSLERIALAKQSGSNSHLLMGVLYAEAGLVSDAEREFNALLAANPNSSTARKLLQSVRQAKR
jgi:hypothetical protein